MKPARLGLFLLILTSTITALLTLTLLICGYLEAWHAPWFEQRYAPTIAIAHGQPIYRVPPAGPLFSCHYAPLSYLAFLPAAYLPTVQAIFAAGSMISTGFLVIPFALVAYLFVRKHKLALRDWGPLVLFPLTAIASLRPLNYAASFVSADSPAICFTAFSLLFLYWDRDRPRLTTAACSSAALVLSVGCKQNMAFPALVIILAVFYFLGRKFGWSYLAFTIAFSVLAIGIVIAVHHDLSAVYFNDVVIPSRLPVVAANLFPAAYRLYENSAVLAYTLTGMGLIWFLTNRSISCPSGFRFIVTFFAVAAVLSVLSIRIYAVAGGDANDFSHAVYFWLLGIVIAAFEQLVLTKSKPEGVLALRVLIVMAALTLLGSGLPTRYNAEWKLRMRHAPGAIGAYEYSKRNPGQVYFPWNSVAVYLAERHFYHTEWGVMIQLMAGQRLKPQEVFRYIPDKARYVAIPQDYILDDPGAVMPFIAPHRLPATVPGLKGFAAFVIER